MTENEPERIDEALSTTTDVPGTAQGAPVEGAEIDEVEAEQAVEPDDKPFEVDGPQASAGHA